MNIWPPKDPDESLDYGFDWALRLASGETITQSNFLLAEGDVVIDDKDLVGTIATVWLSAGTVDTYSIITNRVTTNDGRTYDESAKLRIRTK